jgi:hypothetical protein
MMKHEFSSLLALELWKGALLTAFIYGALNLHFKICGFSEFQVIFMASGKSI